ncbi:hypothetical protein V8B97DRAFT_1922379 [Scleroderma yunnanense]
MSKYQHKKRGSSKLPLRADNMNTTVTNVPQGHIVHYETRLQRTKKEKLKRTQSPINSLPNELLSYILEITIEATSPKYDPHRVRKLELATVSRRWRDIILDTPTFWSFIRLAHTWRKSFV